MSDLSAPVGAAASPPTAAELEERAGFDPGFLGVEVPMPELVSDVPTVTLDYTHYSLRFRPDRRFAAVTAHGLDGARLFDLHREDTWRLDPRLAAELQAGPAVYVGNELDRGHLVARASVSWGRDEAEARRGDAESCYYPNAAPQAALFDQGRGLWLGLEVFLQRHAATVDQKLVVLAGPVLDPADPPYRGINLPLRFWKVVAFLQDGALAATGYVLDQSPLVDDLEAAFVQAGVTGIPPLGPFRTFQVPIADIAPLAGVDLGRLVPADRFGVAVSGAAPPPPGRAAPGWLPLGSPADVRVTPA